MSNNSRGRHAVIFIVTASVVVLADQLTKLWIQNAIPLGGSVPPSGFFRITHVTNTGAAFGLFPDSTLALTVIRAIGAILLLWLGLFMSRRLPFLSTKVSQTALGLVLGGTIGNLIDCLRQGFVTDFIKVGIWPDFNVADSAVVVGGILLALSLILAARTETSDGKGTQAPR